MSSTRERDAFPKTLSRCTRLMFSSTGASTSQWESSVFVSPINAPALIILDVYVEDGGSRFFASPRLGGIFFRHRLPEFVFDSFLIFSTNQQKGKVCPKCLRALTQFGRALPDFSLVYPCQRMTVSGTRYLTWRTCSDRLSGKSPPMPAALLP